MKKLLAKIIPVKKFSYYVPENIVTENEKNERLVEIPWALSHYAGQERVLDVGPVGAQSEYINQLRDLKIPELYGIDITEKEVEGFKMVFGDIRKTQFENNFFNLIFCISTLEHVGQNNRWYKPSKELVGLGSVEFEPGEISTDKSFVTDDDILAVREMIRITKPKGHILITLPFGKFQNHGWFKNYDQELLDRLIKVAKISGCKIVEERYFAWDKKWYEERNPKKLKDRWYQSNGAAKASAIACIVIEKL